MNTPSLSTEAVVSHHLQAFLKQEGADAIVEDYKETARFFTETKIHHGRGEIRDFFMRFTQSLPPGAIERFELRTMQVKGPMAYITWTVGHDIPLGTDTFVVEDGQIVLQSFAMYVAPFQQI